VTIALHNIEIEEEINREIKFSQIEGNLEKIQLVKREIQFLLLLVQQ
jgi:hypothetical protein